MALRCWKVPGRAPLPNSQERQVRAPPRGRVLGQPRMRPRALAALQAVAGKSKWECAQVWWWASAPGCWQEKLLASAARGLAPAQRPPRAGGAPCSKWAHVGRAIWGEAQACGCATCSVTLRTDSHAPQRAAAWQALLLGSRAHRCWAGDCKQQQGNA